MKSSLLLLLWPSPNIIPPEDPLPAICRTDLIHVFFNYIAAIAPYWKKRKFPYFWKESEFYPDLRKIRRDICNCLSDSEKTIKSPNLSQCKNSEETIKSPNPSQCKNSEETIEPPNLSQCGKNLIQFGKKFGYMISDFEWKVKSLVNEVLFHKDFVTTNRDIYLQLGPPPKGKDPNLARNLVELLNFTNLNKAIKNFDFEYEDEIIKPDYSFPKLFLNYIAFLTNIMIHKPSPTYYWYSMLHEKMKILEAKMLEAGNINKSSLVQLIPEPSEKLDPNEPPVDIFVDIFNNFILLLFVVCVGYNIYWQLL
jgi:hypothetical protein